MEIEASKQTVCSSCGQYIEIGDTIVPYAGVWIHSTCDFPRLGQGGISAHVQRVQQRNERIKKYHRIHPYMSVRELSEYLAIPKSTVHRVLAQQ